MGEEIGRRLGLHYGSISLFTTILHNLFLLYHVDMFVSVYKIDKFSFWVGETIFLVWNSCNDPLFGWLSDRKYLNPGSPAAAGDGSSVVISRLHALSWNGPLFACSFVAFWFAWAFPSLQFAICLCAYDGFLTMIDLNHSALLADLAVHASARARLKMYCSVFGAIGAMSVFASYIFWNRGIGSTGTLVPFQTFCVALAVISVIGFVFSTRTLKLMYLHQGTATHPFHHPKSDDDIDGDEGKGDAAPDETIFQDKAVLKKFIKQLSGQQNFIWFTAMNITQVFHCHFNSNFFPLFIDSLLGDEVPPYICSIILGVSFMAPHINNLYFLSLCRRYGTYFVIRLLFWIKFLLAVTMLVIGLKHVWVISLFIASNRVFTEGTCKLLNLVISDLVDEDVVLHGRHQAVSALMFGTVALLSKPGQTLAPLIGTWLLALQTGHDVFASGTETGSIKLDVAAMTTDARYEYQLGVFRLLVFVPLLCAGFQLWVWSRFTLHGKRLDWVKSVRAGVCRLTMV